MWGYDRLVSHPGGSSRIGVDRRSRFMLRKPKDFSYWFKLGGAITFRICFFHSFRRKMAEHFFRITLDILSDWPCSVTTETQTSWQEARV